MKSMTDEMLSEARDAFIRGDYRTAEPLLHQVLLRDSRQPEVHQMLATLYYDQGKFSKAVQNFKRALEIDPTYTDASVGLSIILNDLGRYEEGRKIFDEAREKLDRLKGRPDTRVDEKLAAKHEELADLYLQYRRPHEALEQLAKAKALSIHKGEVTLRIADVLVQAGQVDKAIAELRQVVRENPQMHQARLKLGLVLYNSNNVADAVEQWENILARDPQNSEALRHLKMAQAAGITSLDL